MAIRARTFIGVDLGGGKGKHTAVARLVARDDGRLEVAFVGTTRAGRDPFYDDVLLETVGEHPGAVLAIDAPLTLTACVRCPLTACPGLDACVDPAVVWFRTEGAEIAAAAEAERAATGPLRSPPPGRPKPTVTPYTQRAAEVILHRRHGILPRETLGQGMGPLTARAAHLVKRLAAIGFFQFENLIEVYPKATLHQLFGARIARRYRRQPETWETRAGILESLGDVLEFGPTSRMARESCLTSDHCFDALLCAYTGFLWARDGWTLPEAHREVWRVDGWIWFPPGPGRDATAAPPGTPPPAPPPRGTSR